MQNDFADKVVVVTGASEGIGRAFCLELAAGRPKLVLAARNEARLNDVARQCQERGAQVLVVPTDVTLVEDCKRLIDKTVAVFGGVDVLVNNAGITMWANFDETSDVSLVKRVMAVNFHSVAYCTHFALPYLKRSQGRLVGVASLAGLIGVPGHSIYGASKHAIFGFLNSLRIELAAYGVSVTIISPDFVATELHQRGLRGDGSLMQQRLDTRRYMPPDECAHLMVSAIARRKRQLVTSPRGKLAAFARDLVPGLVDRIVSWQAHKSQLLKSDHRG